MLEVGNGRRQDREFFGQLSRQMAEQNGYGKLLHYLQTFDLTTVDIGRVPTTTGLLSQKKASLSPEHSWRAPAAWLAGGGGGI